ncbi:AraC family transcriptional regulator [Parabacteroides johnsonii]|uniref:AraC family transcriptional regulator n=1 Tax=Parabacteroides johnsonii TaxID=387661 RepID=UPI0011DD0434|nr:helix-turn-helix domain-containing protein [Parabacteroides johnsonii]MBP3641016.1 AraC family transcriptional regulator [Parabacteroides sp.]
MSQQLPQRQAYMLSDLGIRLRKIVSSQDGDTPVRYSHQDDYYIIGMVDKGTGHGFIDFKEIAISQGEIFLVQPRQVHRFIGSEDVECRMLLADNSYVGHEEKRIFDKFRLFGSSVKTDERRMGELKQLFAMLANRINHVTDEQTKATVRRLTETYIGIVAETIRETELQQARHSHRHIEIVLSFLHLLAGHLATSRSPSYYASQLNISPVYLNEVVKEVTGMSATFYIRNELILQAKRLLVHTGLSVKEISDRLGIEDSAYFSRIFTQTAGISPSTFRRRNLE